MYALSIFVCEEPHTKFILTQNQLVWVNRRFWSSLTILLETEACTTMHDPSTPELWMCFQKVTLVSCFCFVFFRPKRQYCFTTAKQNHFITTLPRFAFCFLSKYMIVFTMYDELIFVFRCLWIRENPILCWFPFWGIVSISFFKNPSLCAVQPYWRPT